MDAVKADGIHLFFIRKSLLKCKASDKLRLRLIRGWKVIPAPRPNLHLEIFYAHYPFPLHIDRWHGARTG